MRWQGILLCIMLPLLLVVVMALAASDRKALARMPPAERERALWRMR